MWSCFVGSSEDVCKDNAAPMYVGQRMHHNTCMTLLVACGPRGHPSLDLATAPRDPTSSLEGGAAQHDGRGDGTARWCDSTASDSRIRSSSSQRVTAHSAFWLGTAVGGVTCVQVASTTRQMMNGRLCGEDEEPTGKLPERVAEQHDRSDGIWTQEGGT